jgi:hypothetical protein
LALRDLRAPSSSAAKTRHNRLGKAARRRAFGAWWMFVARIVPFG